MARLVNTLVTGNTEGVRLTERQRQAAQRRLRRQQQRNPLRRVRLDCHGWVRDPSAVVGDWLFCEHADCMDIRRVVDVAE